MMQGVIIMVTNEFYLADVWNKILSYIRNKGKMGDSVLGAITNGTKIYSLDEAQMVVQCELFLSKVTIQQTSKEFEEAIEAVLGRHIPIVALTVEQLFPKHPEALINSDFIKQKLDSEMTFESFVVGRSNIQAQVSSLTIASNPGLAYNPLFIYGNSGLGKTHLLNAIGNKIRTLYPGYRIGIISGLDFVQGVADSIKTHTIDSFKREFYDLDVLLVDDIQFIAGKEKTHEVFFSVFNELVNNRKQICITSDRMPKDIKGLEDRIISRFNQGLNVNIEAPEYETSLNILKKKLASSGNTQIDEDVLSYIATNFSQDVRQLEGALNRLLFYSIDFCPVDHITIKVAMEAFKDQISEDVGTEMSINTIKKVVCDYYGINKNQLNSKIRTKNIAIPRQIAMYLVRKFLDMPYKDIGNSFGKRDHSTVINACERVEENIKKDPAYAMAINALEEMIKK